jgi:hypothetical protein
MNPRSVIPLLLLLLAGAWCTGCKKKSPAPAPAPAAAHVPGTPHTDEVLIAWRNAGLAPDGFAPVLPPPNSAAYCEHGFVGGVDTLVCEYATPEALSQGVKQVKEGWERVDVHTAVVLQARQTTMVVVDRERREPSGTTISRMVDAFRKL